MNRLVNSYSENNLAVNAHFLLKTFPAQKKIEVPTFEYFYLRIINKNIHYKVIFFISLYNANTLNGFTYFDISKSSV